MVVEPVFDVFKKKIFFGSLELDLSFDAPGQEIGKLYDE